MTTFHLDHRHLRTPVIDRAVKESNRRAIIAHIILLMAIAILGLTQ